MLELIRQEQVHVQRWQDEKVYEEDLCIIPLGEQTPIAPIWIG